MIKIMKYQKVLLLALAVGAFQLPVAAKEIAGIHVKQDIVYGHKLGLAMTLDVLTPKAPNGGPSRKPLDLPAHGCC